MLSIRELSFEKSNIWVKIVAAKITSSENYFVVRSLKKSWNYFRMPTLDT